MDLRQIKLLIDQQHQKYSTSCYLCYVCPKECYLTQPPPPPELLQPPAPKNHLMTVVLILMLSVLALAFLFLSYLTISRYRSRQRVNTETALAGVNESHGPTLDHPIWYIRTVGLPQSTIDSIPIVKYKKSLSSTGKNDCSVCLSEFRDDESLRVLPDCSHAFHVPCIDTWLRSHKNCPVCRAPILIDAASRADSGPAEGSLEAVTEETGGESRVGDLKDGKFRGVSDLGERAVRMNIELVRRSVSMDFSLARMTGKERCSDVETEIGKRGKSSVSMQRVFSSGGCMEGARRGEVGTQIVKAGDN